jgi:hypothetical protein
VKHVALMLRGGFGNQLFQYTAARTLLLKSLNPQLVAFSYGSHRGSNHPDLETVLRIPIHYPGRLQKMRYRHLASNDTWLDTLSGATARVIGPLTSTQVVMQDDPFEPIRVEPAPRYVLDGYFQHRDWWLPAWAHVARELRATEPDGVPTLRRESRVAIKIRRTDYLSNGWQLPDTFYEQAFELLGIRNQEVTAVCEDDDFLPEFATFARRFGCTVAPPVTLTGNPNLDDFWNLAAASTLILANSSYCWWAAAVAQDASAETRVAYPAPWLPNQWSSNPLPDMGLQGWLSLPSGFA